MNIEISNCSTVGLRITATGYFHPCLPSGNPTLGFHCPSWGFTALFGVSRDSHPVAFGTEPLQGPLLPIPAGWGHRSCCRPDSATKGSIKLFLRIKRAFPALIFHMSHTIEDLKVPTPRGNKIMGRKKHELAEREIILNI